MAGQVTARRTKQSDQAMPRSGLADMHPAYFAMVMATGIVSLAAHLQKMPIAAEVLFQANIFFAIVISLLSIYRLVRFPSAVLSDLKHHKRAPAFLTAAAGFAVLGNQFVLQHQSFQIAMALFIVASVLWCIFVYAIFAATSIGQSKLSVEKGLTGAWLLFVVSTEAIAVLAANLTSGFPAYHTNLLIGSFLMWTLGGAMYSWIIAMITYRYLFVPMPADSISPTHWIDMGAMAICTLAGSELISKLNHVAELSAMQPFAMASTCGTWAVASWWWPLAAIFGLAHLWSKKSEFSYQASLWSMVFPLGMYTVCTQKFAEAMGFAFLDWLPGVMVWISLAAWGLVLIGFCFARVKSFTRAT